MAIPQIGVAPGLRNTVLIVDDQATSRTILEQVVLSLDDNVLVEAFESPLTGLAWATGHLADLILVDFQMPEMDGIQFARRVRALPGYAHVPIIMVTAERDSSLRFGALDAGITDFLNKPFDTRECTARCRNLLTMRRQHLVLEDRSKMLESMVLQATLDVRERERETLIRLAKAGEYRDEETGNHVIRMARYSALIARAIGMDADYVETIERAAPLHDIGKIGVPDQILRKPGKLDVDEWKVMRQHPAMGYEILKDSPSKYIRMGAQIALGHHEKYDGSGYPAGLVGDHIPLPGRIVAIADVYDALTSARPYKEKWPSDRAFAYIAETSGTHLDPDLAARFSSLSGEVLKIQHELQDKAGATNS
jgi:two-component system response regulator RpfG